MAFDYKKEYKDLYFPKEKPMVIDVPKMIFITVDGKGNPNTSDSYREAMELEYGLSYTIKMSKMGNNTPQGYFDYVVPPLEGFWWDEEDKFCGGMIEDKEMFCWKSMIRQPKFVTEEVFAWAKETLHKKKPELDLSKAKLEVITEGLCVQIMHHGIYDEEPATVDKMNQFVIDNGYVTDINQFRKHHEIYLSDPRKTAPEKLRTVIRHPVRKENKQ